MMKRTLLAVATLMMTLSTNAQRLTDITTEARLITDKMVVELGLSNTQRNSILQLNINYLDGINSYRDIDAQGWKYRNKQIKRLLTSKQWKAYKEANYFYRPIGWRNNAYVHHIYAKYPNRCGVKGGKSGKHHDRSWRDNGNNNSNNSKEAIRHRREMRRGMMNGAR